MKQQMNLQGVSEQEKQRLTDWAKKWNVAEKHLLTLWEHYLQVGDTTELQEIMKKREELFSKEPHRLKDPRQRFLLPIMRE